MFQLKNKFVQMIESALMMALLECKIAFAKVRRLN